MLQVGLLATTAHPTELNTVSQWITLHTTIAGKISTSYLNVALSK